MPEYRRWREPGATYFFTVVTEHRRRLFYDPEARRLLRAAILETQARWPFSIDAIVLLPEHLHCLWTLPLNDSDFSRRWSFLKRRFSRSWSALQGAPAAISPSRRSHRELGVWQRRFWEHLIRGDDEFLAYRD